MRVIDERAEPRDLDARRFHAGEQALVDAGSPEGVEQDTDPHAGARPLDHGAGEGLADGAVPVALGLDVDRRGGRTDGLEHGRVRLVAVAEDVHLVPAHGGDAEQALERSAETN